MSLPLGVAKSLLNFVPQSAKDKMAEKDIDLNALTKTIDDLSEEKEILRVDDENETVIIRVEQSKLAEAENEIKNGAELLDGEQVFSELREKYGEE